MTRYGAGHGAWCWELFLPYFAGLGYTCHALSLRGHGASDGRASLRWHAMADYVADLAATVADLPPPPVIAVLPATAHDVMLDTRWERAAARVA